MATTTATRQLTCINCSRVGGYLDPKIKVIRAVGDGIKKDGKGLRCGHCGGRIVSEVA